MRPNNGLLSYLYTPLPMSRSYMRVSITDKSDPDALLRAGGRSGDDEEEFHDKCDSKMWMKALLWFVVLSALVLGVLGCIGFAYSTKNNNRIDFERRYPVLNMTGLAAGYFSVTLTISAKDNIRILRVPAYTATCVANGSVATVVPFSASFLKESVPTQNILQSVPIFSQGKNAPGYLSLNSTGYLAIGGYGVDLAIGVCGWKSDLVVSYVVD